MADTEEGKCGQKSNEPFASAEIVVIPIRRRPASARVRGVEIFENRHRGENRIRV
jgi:hypothetical protein